jgi:hypothetical protein
MESTLAKYSLEELDTMYKSIDTPGEHKDNIAKEIIKRCKHNERGEKMQKALNILKIK